jgi:SsrA-binding protein
MIGPAQSIAITPAQCPSCSSSVADLRPIKWSFSMPKQTSNKHESKTLTSNVPIKIISVNRQAYHDYFVERTIEAGISLVGTEIKSIRDGKVNLRGSYAIARNGELWLENAHIAVYEHGNRYNHEPLRNRKLLLHRREIEQLQAKVATKGLTLIPLKLYLKGGKAKIELGLCRGKKLYDKREAIAERDVKREMERVIRKG